MMGSRNPKAKKKKNRITQAKMAQWNVDHDYEDDSDHIQGLVDDYWDPSSDEEDFQ
jgi:hypothetical protein